jgi:hypothetical protein
MVRVKATLSWYGLRTLGSLFPYTRSSTRLDWIRQRCPGGPRKRQSDQRRTNTQRRVLRSLQQHGNVSPLGDR